MLPHPMIFNRQLKPSRFSKQLIVSRGGPLQPLCPSWGAWSAHPALSVSATLPHLPLPLTIKQNLTPDLNDVSRDASSLRPHSPLPLSARFAPNHSCQYWKPHSLMLSPLSHSVSCSSVNVTSTVIRTRMNYMHFLKLRLGLSTEQARGDNSSFNKLWRHILTPYIQRPLAYAFFRTYSSRGHFSRNNLPHNAPNIKTETAWFYPI